MFHCAASWHLNSFGLYLLKSTELFRSLVAQEVYIDDERSVHQEGWLHCLVDPFRVSKCKLDSCDLLSIG